MAASLGILVIRSSLVDWRSMKKSADMRGTVFDFSGVSYEEGEERPAVLPPLQPGRGQEQHPGRDYRTSSVVDPDPDWIRIQWGPWIRIQVGNNDPRPKLEKKLRYFMF